METGQLRSEQELRALIDTLPHDEIVHAFGYGSGIFDQGGSPSHGVRQAQHPIIDLIIVVKNAMNFHQCNIELNPHHYSGVRNARACAVIQNHQLPPNKIWQNPGVFFLVTDSLKYGVVERERLLHDLQNWSYLYIAGRLHKPTVTVLTDDNILHAQENRNLPGALAAGLLLLERETFPADLLFHTIASLSYQGDPRMSVGAEDPEKIVKLVQGSTAAHLDRWHRLYGPAVGRLEENGILTRATDGHWAWDARSPSARQFLWHQLPFHTTATTMTTPLATHLSRTVAPPARYQALKGVVTAGPSRSLAYAYRKLTKGVLRRWK